MKPIFLTLAAPLVFLCAMAHADSQKIPFLGEDFLFRWSEGTQLEFTPNGQEDLKVWKDMVTVNVFPDSTTGEDLAKIANNLLGLYQDNGAHILRTDSIPRTETKEAEHLVTVAFSQPEFIEIAFARLVIEEGKSYSIVFSHRIYGSEIAEAASEWLVSSGQKTELELMALPMDLVVSALEKAE